MRVVASSPDVAAFCRAVRARIAATDYYVSPCDRGDEIDYAAVETVFEPARAALPEDYVPGALGADGQAQRIAAPESVEGEVPFGEVYADYYAAFLQEQLPMALRETAADYLMNLK